MLLHLSDLHFGTEQPRVVHALLALSEQLQPEAVVVSGDLTQRARSHQFAAAQQFLQQLARPYLVVAGNHDIPLLNVPKRWASPFDNFHDYFGDVEPRLETAHFDIIGVNSIRRRFHTQGHLSHEQIARIVARLQHSDHQKRRVIVSHQPFAVIDRHQHRDVPRRMPKAVQHWAAHGADLFLHGHCHTPAVFDLNTALHLGLGRSVLDVQAGTGMSARLRGGYPNSVNLIYPDLRVERWDYHEACGQFRVVDLLWPKSMADA
jgi:3',5'-cyclic AMP phosphodiesterase CpdA